MGKRRTDNLKVLFILPYPLNTVPGQRLKFEQYLEYFRKNNIEITVRTFIDEEFYKILYKKGYYFRKVVYTLRGYIRRISDIFSAGKFDVIYLFLWLVPFGPAFFEFLLKAAGKPIIYDIDDLVYLPHSSSANKFVRFLKNKNRILLSMKMADHVIVCTEHLKRYALQHNKRVTNISSTIDTEKYFVNFHTNNKNPVIGWSGSHSTSMYLHLLDDILKELQKKYSIGIKVIGDRDFSIPGVKIEAKDWAEGTEVQDLQEFDIGLYPLPDEEWILGKSGLKALQYMGVGIPVVCTKIGAVLDFIQNNVNGLLVATQEEWLEKLSLLIESPDLRKKIGRAGRETVEQRFSVNVNSPVYLRILEETSKKKT